MNEFEKQLGSIDPSQGKSDPMQIMFLAGQQSIDQPTAGAGGWKIFSGILSIACVLLTAGLITLMQSKTPNAIAKESGTPKEVQASDDLPVETPPPQLVSTTPDTRLQNPESWRSLGPRIRQLQAVTQDDFSFEDSSSGNRLTPFTFRRQRTRNSF